MSEFEELFSEMSNGELGTIFAGLMVFLGIFLFIAIICIIFNIIARWIFFNKCGEKGWKALIPVYDEYILLKISGMNWWWIFLLYASSILSIVQSTINILAANSQALDLSIVSLFISLLSFAASAATIITKVNESINISKKFHKGAGYAVLLVFFEPIMLLILGASKNNKYDSSVKVSPNGFFGGNK